MKLSFNLKKEEGVKIIQSLLRFRQLRISRQLFIAFLIVITFSFFLLIVNVWSTNQILKANRQLIKAYTYRSIVNDLKHISSKRSAQLDFLRRLSQNNVPLELKDDILIQSVTTEGESNAANMEMVLQDLAPDKLAEYRNIINNEVIASSKAWENNKQIGVLLAISSALRRFELFIIDLATKLDAQITARVSGAEIQIKSIQLFNILCNLLIPALLLIIIIPLLRDMKRLFTPVHQAADKALQGATDAFQYARQINESIAELKHVLTEISQSIGEVSKGAQDSSAQAEKIIYSVQATSDLVAELGEIANTVYKNLDANQTNLQEKIAQVKQLSENVSQSLETINRNADVAASLAKQVAALEEQMAGINSFLVAMGEITEQTNLLALNASIEAARAEEHGKGFAVVAERIRNLSDETKKFTSQIKITVAGIQSVAVDVAGALNNIIAAVRSSASEVLEVNREFANLQTLLQSLYSSNAAVLQAADLQLDGTKQIHSRTLDIIKAVENITAQTQQVSSSMEELAASSQEINAQIELIHSKVYETREVVERQLELAKLSKETADHI